MTEPTDLEYCVRHRAGRIVVPWRPAGRTRSGLAHPFARAIRRRSHEQRARLRPLP